MDKCSKYQLKDNPLDSLDFQSPEFKDGVSDLAKLLKIPEHPNHLVTLKAINHLIQTRLSRDAVKLKASTRPRKPENIEDDQIFTLDNCPLGFQVQEKELIKPAKVLRMLYVNDLRELQNKINHALITVQSITANPKTDSSLGQVGR